MPAEQPGQLQGVRAASGRVQRWGIAGVGAQAAAIARALRSVPGVELAGCVSSAGDRAAEFGRRHGCPAYRSETEFFARGFDLVVVASANARHAELSTAALHAGSAVLCEKPLALSVDDAERVLCTATSVGRPLFTGYHLRFQPLTAEIRQVIADGELGAIGDIYLQRYSEQVTAEVRPWRRDLAQAGAGVLCDVAVHLFDYLSWIAGLTVTSVGAVATPPRGSGEPDEHVVVSLELDGGALAVVDAARSLPCGDNALHVHGSRGSLCTGALRWTSEFRAEVRCAAGRSRTLRAPSADPLLSELVAVRDACDGRLREPLATGEDGRRGVAVLQAAIRSLETGRRIVPQVPGRQPWKS